MKNVYAFNVHKTRDCLPIWNLLYTQYNDNKKTLLR